MMTNQTAGVFVPEGPSLNRPPTFDGKYYYYWKERMKLFLESQDVDLRYCCGWTCTPTTTNAEGASTLKPKDSWTPNKKKWPIPSRQNTILHVLFISIVYGKACHLSFELEHIALWGTKYLNFNCEKAGEAQILQLQ